MKYVERIYPKTFFYFLDFVSVVHFLSEIILFRERLVRDSRYVYLSCVPYHNCMYKHHVIRLNIDQNSSSILSRKEKNKEQERRRDLKERNERKNSKENMKESHE